MSVVKIIKGKIDRWYNYGELSNICNKINKEISDRVIVNNIRTNTIANPKSVLNLLNLSLRGGDEIEVTIISDSESKADKTVVCLKKILSNNVTFFVEE